MSSVTEQTSLEKRKAKLEYQKCLLQTSALMRLRTGQKESKLSEMANERLQNQLDQLSLEMRQLKMKSSPSAKASSRK